MTFFVIAVLAALCAGEFAALVLLERMWAHERRHLTDSVVARHAPDLVALTGSTDPVPVKVKPRRATDDRPGVNLAGNLIDQDGQVVDESVLIGLAGN